MTAAQAPLVQVPSHVDVRDGQITLVDNDRTRYLPEAHRLLPLPVRLKIGKVPRRAQCGARVAKQ